MRSAAPHCGIAVTFIADLHIHANTAFAIYQMGHEIDAAFAIAPGIESPTVSPLAKEFARASTTVIDVCMKMIYGAYTERLDRGLRDQLAYQSRVLEQWFRTTYGMAKANPPVAP